MFLIILVNYWLFYPYKVIEFKNLPFPIQSTVERGQFISYDVEFCKFIDSGAVVTRSFVDGIIYTVPDIVTNQKKGCRTNKIEVYVSKTLSPGDYFIKGVYKYKVNPIREIFVTTTTQHFTITK